MAEESLRAPTFPTESPVNSTMEKPTPMAAKFMQFVQDNQNNPNAATGAKPMSEDGNPIVSPVRLPGAKPADLKPQSTQAKQPAQSQQKPAQEAKPVVPPPQSTDEGPSIMSMLDPDYKESEASKPVDEPKPEPAEEPDADVPKNLSAKAGEHFKAIKEKAARYRSEREAIKAEKDKLEQELAALKAKPAVVPDDYEALKKRADEFERTVKELSVERHPEFKAHYAAKEAGVEATLKNVLPADKAVAILKAVKLSDPELRDEKLAKLTEGLSAMHAATVSLALDKWNSIQTEKAEQIGKASEALLAYEKREEERRAAQQSGVSQFSQKALDTAKGLATKVPAFKEIAGDDVHNAEVRRRAQFVDDFHRGKLKPEVFAAIPVVVQQADYMARNVIPKLQKENAELRATITRMGGASPGADGGTSKAGSAPSKPSGVGGFKEAWRSAMQGEVEVPKRR